METLSYIALILLSLVGYSGGAAGISGKQQEPKPELLDLILVCLLWAGAVFSRSELEINRWLLVLGFLLLGITLGCLSWLPKSHKKKIPAPEKIASEILPKSNLWQRWKNFSHRMGGFQSRLLLSLFYFILVTPFALIIKLFSDPLRLKEKPADSFWLPRPDSKTDLEDSRRQF